MSAEDRVAVQEWWTGSDRNVVVATIAFGMGIDKADVRYVYHFNLPKGLESRARTALAAGDAAGVERALMVFFASLARDLAVEGERQLAAGAAASVVGPRFLEAIWRYYNLVDFAVGQRDARASVAMRLAYDDAEGATRGTADRTRLRDALRRMAQILGGVVN